MEILRKNSDINLVINNDMLSKANLGWSESFSEYETELLNDIINPAQNYETVRFIHKQYSGITSNPNVLQTDIWFYFYFISGNTYVQNYEPIGITPQENAKMLAQSTKSFFRLEFYKTENNEIPDRTNRRLVFSKNLSIPLGEKFYYTGNNINDYISVPVFVGSNYRNKENMYLFWFQDDSVFSGTTLTGNTFWVSARFFNAKDGSISDFTNYLGSGYTSNTVINESRDMYYRMDIDRTDYSYQMYKYTSGTTGNRIGIYNNPIRFYQRQ